MAERGNGEHERERTGERPPYGEAEREPHELGPEEIGPTELGPEDPEPEDIGPEEIGHEEIGGAAIRRGEERRLRQQHQEERRQAAALERQERLGRPEELGLVSEAPLAARFDGAVRRVAWGALFGGLVLGLVVQLSLALLGIAVGAASIQPLRETNPAAGLGLGAALWWLGTMLVSMFAGAWAAARLAGVARRLDGVLHGLITWGLLTLVMFTLVGTVLGNVIGGAFGALGQTLGLAARGAAAAATATGGEAGGETAKQQAQRDLGDRAAGMKQALDRLFTDEGVTSDSARAAAVDALEARGTPRPQAEEQVDRWVRLYQETHQRVGQALQGAGGKARQVGSQVSEAVAKVAGLVFISLALGALIAAFGGALGAGRRRVLTRPPPLVH